MKRRLLAVALLAAALAAHACQLLDSNDTFEIPQEYATSDEAYTLLYSTLGYDAAATKRVLIRQNSVEAPPAQGLAFEWRLVDDENGNVVGTGLAQYAGTGWSIPVWVADFTDLHEEGVYRMTVESTNVALATDAFPVGDFLLSGRTFVPIALDAATARSAPIEMDNGYFEPNTMEGTSFAHAEFMLGLLTFYGERRASMTEDMRVRTKGAIDRAFDYLILLLDPATGEAAHAAPTRPFSFGDSSDDTVAATRALARYSAVFRAEDPGRAERAHRRARQGDRWLLENAADDYPPWAQAQVAYDNYSYIGDLAELDRAVRAVRSFAPGYDLPAMNRFSQDTMPHFETMYRLWQTQPDHPDRSLWEETADRLGAQYAEMVERNPFAVVPPGVSHDGGPSAQDQWNTVETDPLPGDGDDAMIGNEWFMARAIDATYLSRITEDPELEQVATGSMLWITGLNPGIPVERTPGPRGGGSSVEAASFLFGLDGRAVHPAPHWEWQRHQPLADVAGGFRRSFTYDDSTAAGSSSISRNGLWLQALVAYEDFIHPEARSRTPDEFEAPQVRMRVASFVASEQDGIPTGVVTVVDANGTPLRDVRVSAVWISTPRPDQAVEEAIFADECVTVSGGSCVLSLDAEDRHREGPVRLLVTSLEHADLAFVAGPGVLPDPAVFD